MQDDDLAALCAGQTFEAMAQLDFLGGEPVVTETTKIAESLSIDEDVGASQPASPTADAIP